MFGRAYVIENVDNAPHTLADDLVATTVSLFSGLGCYRGKQVVVGERKTDCEAEGLWKGKNVYGEARAKANN
ncbi:hypothetical protein DXG03_002952 [Asterophora parasitica]|uniref:Uncharacterized protein n=1 Tax=Asterophora parasitica TaxID=117018 RepID=A0A9P7G1H4_9AGAR|nr:hypothetical protein DXG03_002952 [Asterophora parasitica]